MDKKDKNDESSKTKKTKRRRRNKKDVVLDFRKTGKRRETGQAAVIPIDEFYKIEANKKGKSNKGKITLTTSSKDYDGTLGLPETVTQREFETTGQFFRRIDRLVAKARLDANLETRFDMTLPHHQKAKESDEKTQESKKKVKGSNKKVKESNK